MEKTKTIIIILASVIAVLLALGTVYQIYNPPDPDPDQGYTAAKASLMLTDYAALADVTEDENGFKPKDLVYAVLIEQYTEELKESGIISRFVCFDITGESTFLYSNYSGYKKGRSTFEDTAKVAVEAANECFDDTYKVAGKSHYGTPDKGYVKIYVKRGNGVYIKTYGEKECPADLIKYANECFAEAYKDALTD